MLRDRVFDIDHTLYPYSAGVESWFCDKIDKLIQEELGLHFDEAAQLRDEYYQLFGSTMSGLMYFHDMSAHEFLRRKGLVPLNTIQRNEAALKKLQKCPARKIAYTNASSRHGHRVLAHLGLLAKFEQVIGIDQLGFWGKPFRRSFQRFFKLTNIDPENAILFEDSPRNLVYAKSRGMITVLIGQEQCLLVNTPEYVDFHARNLQEALEMTDGL